MILGGSAVAYWRKSGPTPLTKQRIKIYQGDIFRTYTPSRYYTVQDVCSTSLENCMQV